MSLDSWKGTYNIACIHFVAIKFLMFLLSPDQSSVENFSSSGASFLC